MKRTENPIESETLGNSSLKSIHAGLLYSLAVAKLPYAQLQIPREPTLKAHPVTLPSSRYSSVESLSRTLPFIVRYAPSAGSKVTTTVLIWRVSNGERASP